MQYPLVLVLFLVSGLVGLGYQILWSKYLLDFIGVSAYSYATVLASFMAGLAIGSKYIGRYADRSKSPLRLYAYLELCIGVYAILYPGLMRFVSGAYGHWVAFTPNEAGGTYGLGAKIVVSGLLLLPPTILMGGTYPVLLRHVTDRLDTLGRKASQLYAINAVGAVLGTLLMAFFLMPLLGMSSSLMLLAFSNTLLAIVAFLAGKISQAPSPTEQQESVFELLLKPWQLRLCLSFIFVEGLLAFTYEIAWTRYFGLVLGSSTYSFSMMLAAFISGIALGSAWLSRLSGRMSRPLRFFGGVQITVGVLVLLSLPLYTYVPWLFEQLGGLFSFRKSAFYAYEIGKLLLCYLVMLPPTIFIGMSLPLMVKATSDSLADVGKDSGRIYSWNTWGNVAGALLAGLLLLPWLGMERLIGWASIATIALGLASLIVFAEDSLKQRTMAWKAAGFLVLVLIFRMASSGWDHRWFTLIPFRRSFISNSFQEAKMDMVNREIALFVDDPAGHLIVEKLTRNGIQKTLLLVNGKVDASSGDDMLTQMLLAHVPLMFHRDPKDVMVIGMATGVTSGAVLHYPIRRADVVEIMKSMPRASKYFDAWNGRPFADPRFHLIIDDARSYLSYTKQKYDVIIAEPSNPWVAGVGSLFTTDFYLRASQALRPGGIYLQWVQSYEMRDETYAAIARSFRTAFPYTYSFRLNADSMLLGAREPLNPDWNAMEKRFEIPSVKKDLQSLGIQTLPTLLFLQDASPAVIDSIASYSGDENTDDNHLLEYQAPVDLFLRLTPVLPARLDERLLAAPNLFWTQYIHSHPAKSEPLHTFRFLNVPGAANTQIIHAFQYAVYQLNGQSIRQLPPDLIPLFPETSLVDPPLTSQQVADRFTALLQNGKVEAASSLLNSYSPGICIETALAAPSADFWIKTAEKWMDPRLLSMNQAGLRKFQIEILISSGRLQDAGRELLNWVNSPAPPPPEWGVLRAAEIDPDNLRLKIIRIYKQKTPALFLNSLEEMAQSAAHAAHP